MVSRGEVQSREEGYVIECLGGRKKRRGIRADNRPVDEVCCRWETVHIGGAKRADDMYAGACHTGIC